MIEKELSDSLKAAGKLLDNIPNIIENSIKEYVKKYGNEKLVREYINLLMKGDNDKANKLLKRLENGE